MQVVPEEVVSQQVEERAEEMLVYRDVFRQRDFNDATDDSVKIVDPADVLAEPAEIQAAAEYPETREEYDKIEVKRRKYGAMLRVPEEDLMDSTIDALEDHVDAAARKMAEFLDGQAFAELNANLNAAGPVNSGSSDGTLSYDDVLAGRTTLMSDNFNPDMAIVEPNGMEDLLTDDDFTRSTDLGDEVVTTGQIGSVAGLNVMVSNTGDLGDNDAFVVDSDYYGIEGVWTDVETEQETAFDTDELKYKIRTHRGWKAIKPEAAVKVQG